MAFSVHAREVHGETPHPMHCTRRMYGADIYVVVGHPRGLVVSRWAVVVARH